MFGLRENSEMPICKTHVTKIIDCHPCQKRLVGFWQSMSKAGVRVFPGMSGADYNLAFDQVNLQNQSQLHSWAVANLYGDPNALGEEPF
jgi:hypothetical protein